MAKQANSYWPGDFSGDVETTDGSFLASEILVDFSHWLLIIHFSFTYLIVNEYLSPSLFLTPLPTYSQLA